MNFNNTLSVSSTGDSLKFWNLSPGKQSISIKNSEMYECHLEPRSVGFIWTAHVVFPVARTLSRRLASKESLKDAEILKRNLKKKYKNAARPTDQWTDTYAYRHTSTESWTSAGPAVSAPSKRSEMNKRNLIHSRENYRQCALEIDIRRLRRVKWLRYMWPDLAQWRTSQKCQAIVQRVPITLINTRKYLKYNQTVWRGDNLLTANSARGVMARSLLLQAN